MPVLPYLAAGARWPKPRIPEKCNALLHLRRVRAFALDISENIIEEGKPDGLFRRVGGRCEELYSRYTERFRVR